jgi:hypothetical protein
MVKILRAARVQARPLGALSERNECVSGGGLEMPTEIGQLLPASVKSSIAKLKKEHSYPSKRARIATRTVCR